MTRYRDLYTRTICSTAPISNCCKISSSLTSSKGFIDGMEFNFLNYNTGSVSVLDHRRSKKVSVHLDPADIFHNKPQPKKRPHSIHVYSKENGNGERIPLKSVKASKPSTGDLSSSKKMKLKKSTKHLENSQPNALPKDELHIKEGTDILVHRSDPVHDSRTSIEFITEKVVAKNTKFSKSDQSDIHSKPLSKNKTKPLSEACINIASKIEANKVSLDSASSINLPTSDISLVDDSEEEPILLTSSSIHSQIKLSQTQPIESAVDVASNTLPKECKPANNRIVHESQISNNNFQGEDLASSQPISQTHTKVPGLYSSPRQQIQDVDTDSSSKRADEIIANNIGNSPIDQESKNQLNHSNHTYTIDTPKELQEPEVSNSDSASIVKTDQKLPVTESHHNSFSTSNVHSLNNAKARLQKTKKPTLAELCSRTNHARVPGKVGLSRRTKIDSLHTYLNK